MTRRRPSLYAFLAVSVASACGDLPHFAIVDGGADAGTDADSDADTDTDTDTDTDADADAGVDPDAGADGGAEPDSGTADGACTNADDLAILVDGDANDVTFQCSTACLLSEEVVTAECVANCVAQATGLSEECASCFGGLAQCTATYCAVECAADTTSAECLACIDAQCNDAFEGCSGVSP